ncbi:hypothetical protein PACTADRAFT_49176 [Pachysolen tannophilus NRRL Y-2460]|uniref:Glucosamine/galactosamine-6-phosphate isomerase domain-containing protein n=1 Tax=Pachysolen tannophilus NRRL Y-2460 TaxID=669874 RepID=A0A1E4U0C5_PACTA|nr:hypothetical protein PACTADRAFT_49176 [Pachysolen tannophilus NRRL Y-2460]
MTTTVPLIYSFHEFSGVADAVADHVIAAQNSTLYEDVNKKTPTLQNNNTNEINNQNNDDIIQNNNNNNNIDKDINSSSSTNISRIQSKSSNTSHQEQQQQSSSSSSNIKKAAKMAMKKERDLANKRFKIAISGGSLISVLNEGLLPRSDEIEWSRWDVYFADERLVPFDSPDSNYGLAKRNLFDLIPEEKGKPKIYHIDETLINDPQECADSYEKSLIKGFAAKDSVKIPMFDLLLLGCAPDGHIASLFPNQSTLRENHAWVVPVENAPSGPSQRITLTIPVISHSHRVTFVVEGSTKAPVVKTIMERPEKGLPSSIVNEGAAGRVIWFVDDAALYDVDVKKREYKFLVEKKQ